MKKFEPAWIHFCPRGCYHCNHNIFKKCVPEKCEKCPKYRELEEIRLQSKNLHEWLNYPG